MNIMWIAPSIHTLLSNWSIGNLNSCCAGEFTFLSERGNRVFLLTRWLAWLRQRIENKGRDYGAYVRAGDFRWWVRETGTFLWNSRVPKSSTAYTAVANSEVAARKSRLWLFYSIDNKNCNHWNCILRLCGTCRYCWCKEWHRGFLAWGTHPVLQLQSGLGTG